MIRFVNKTEKGRNEIEVEIEYITKMDDDGSLVLYLRNKEYWSPFLVIKTTNEGTVKPFTFLDAMKENISTVFVL